MRTTRLITSVALALVVGCSSDTTGSDGTGTEATGASTATGTATTGDSGGGTAGTDTAGTDTGGTDTGGIDTAGTGNARWLEACPADEPEMRMVDVGQVTLHVACQGSGPTVILLHGFPEFWYGWHKVIPELAAKGFRVVVPDQRGYNLSDKPAEQADYGIEHLVADIDGLIDAVSDEPVVLVGHDWGGVVAWASASVLSDKIDRLVIANGPHPQVFANEIENNPEQASASGYVQLLLTEGTETALAADNWALLAGGWSEILTEEEIDKYRAAWSQPNAMLSMVRWYRANFVDGKPATADAHVTIPTLVSWGMDDTALLPGNIVGLDAYVTDLQIKQYPGVGHWINLVKGPELADDIARFANGETVGEPPSDLPVDPGTTGTEPAEEPTQPPELPDGMHADAAPEYKALHSEWDGVVDQDKTPMVADDFLGHWTVLWFYPFANTSG